MEDGIDKLSKASATGGKDYVLLSLAFVLGMQNAQVIIQIRYFDSIDAEQLAVQINGSGQLVDCFGVVTLIIELPTRRDRRTHGAGEPLDPRLP